MKTHKRFYLDMVQHIEKITPERQKEILEDIANGDDKDFSELIEGNLRLVYTLAKDYSFRTGHGIDDLIQEGTLGLMKSVDSFDATRGCFSKHASQYIRNYIRKFLSNDKSVKIPHDTYLKIRRIQNVETTLKNKSGKLPTNAEIADNSTFTEREVELLRNIKVEISHYDQFDEGCRNIEDIMTPKPMSALVKDELYEDVDRAMEILSTREKDVIYMYFGYKSKQMSTKEIARIYGITISRVQQIKSDALLKMREFIL